MQELIEQEDKPTKTIANHPLVPLKCPSCNKDLVLSKTGTDLFCTNSYDCFGQIVGRLTYYTSRQNANIVGLSEKILEKLIKKINIYDIDHLYNLPFSELGNMEGFGEKSLNNLKESIEKSRNSMDASTFLASLGIDGIGKEVSKIIIKDLLEIKER